MDGSRAPVARYELPRLSINAFHPRIDELRVIAIEGRSVVYGMMSGLRLTLAQLVARFPSAEAHMKSSSASDSRLFYKWGRGEGAPRRTHVFYRSKRRSLLDIFQEELPDVRRRVQHPVWAAADARDNMHEEAAQVSFASLPMEARAPFIRDAKGDRLAVTLTEEGVADALRAATSDFGVANLAAALLLWARSPMVQAYPYMSPQTYVSAASNSEYAAPIIERFVHSSWIYPEDTPGVTKVLTRAMRRPFRFDRAKLDPLGLIAALGPVQMLQALPSFLGDGRPLRRHSVHQPS